MLTMLPLLVLASFTFTPHFEQKLSPWQKTLNYARDNLPQSGQLKMKSDGYIYLHVDDRYIYTLFPMLGLKHEGFRMPPYFRSPDAPGAHISVFYSDEHIDLLPEDIDRTFNFILRNITIVRTSHHVKYAVLQVKSPELEKLRMRYGRPPLLFGHDFHITLAKKELY